MAMNSFGFYRIAVVSPTLAVANPAANAKVICDLIDKHHDADLILFPELSLTGYTCADLFHQQSLLAASNQALAKIVAASNNFAGIVVVGCPLPRQGELYNAAVAICSGEVLAVIPKTYLPTYREFYEQRWFRSGSTSRSSEVEINGACVPFGTDILLRAGEAIIGIEICEDLWMPIPPSSQQALAGANVLLNLSASNDVVGKADWRRKLVESQSGRCLAAYAYSSAGPDESTTDLVFGGHCLIAENGTLLAEQRALFVDSDTEQACYPANVSLSVDIDLQRLQHERHVQNTFQPNSQTAAHSFRTIEAPVKAVTNGERKLQRDISPHPFVPQTLVDLDERCGEVLAIQSASLAKRLKQLPETAPLLIGVSGGLDSTLALLVAVQTCQQLGWPAERILGLTMPGFGTSQRTLSNARSLAQGLAIRFKEIDICGLAFTTFQEMKYQPFGLPCDQLTLSQFQESLRKLPAGSQDLTFENVQARLRTYLLMSHGFVLGTGDLSEQALGWSTYNGDHMSMYNVNTSIPKTLVRFLVRYVADHHFSGELRTILHAIADTPISPELLPLSSTGEIVQDTEGLVGPYELHDFFLYYLVRFGFTREKILYLAKQARFDKPYSTEEIESSLNLFLTRFFAQQYKRSCVPDGPKVGTVSLSPRGDWRMPSDADRDAF